MSSFPGADQLANIKPAGSLTILTSDVRGDGFPSPRMLVFRLEGGEVSVPIFSEEVVRLELHQGARMAQIQAVEPGRYLVAVAPSGVYGVYDVGEGENRSVTLRTDSLAYVSVWPASGGVGGATNLLWVAASSHVRTSISPEEAVRIESSPVFRKFVAGEVDGESGAWRISCLPGTLTLLVVNSEGRSIGVAMEQTVASGYNDVVYEDDPSLALEARIKVNATEYASNMEVERMLRGRFRSTLDDSIASCVLWSLATNSKGGEILATFSNEGEFLTPVLEFGGFIAKPVRFKIERGRPAIVNLNLEKQSH